MLPSIDELRQRLGVDRVNAHNIRELLRLAHARGRVGRWPRQDFEHQLDWHDGYLIDRVAILADIDTEPLFELYVASHAAGLRGAA